uniref:FHF complex subunit HOOK-interacting protein 1B n=1 Tax=Geotrypetes seraphini TaxID=260995 RepID=A0A6P8R4Q5_GEOSA|nr:FTS and Hook-interacting protein [Geotrypetes seraphini]XP_033805049.1 FTS and Hook-interacting protein [Geotrypetes seraphini]XP_033805050.1 FTS and Hook-interacting protein [Geotrypetes seraphini]XP_033805051.1 FTS and Hook-interacting protein [Geotrypetes seraphini]
MERIGWLSKLNPRGAGSRANRNASLQTPVTADPETCLMVFKNHWSQVLRILEKRNSKLEQVASDDLSAVRNNTYQMMNLLAEDRPRDEVAMGPILGFVVSENILERLLHWHLQWDFSEEKKVEQLKLYEMLISQSRQPLLRHKPVLQPLVTLLSTFSPQPASPVLETNLVLLLNQLCVSMAKEPSILELFFASPAEQGPTNLIIFSLLIPFIHQEGVIGQQARDALLLIMAMSASSEMVAKYITENSYFCPVLATGLSALYSSLPRKIEVRGDDWHFLRREDWIGVSSLVLFMNSLEFCNAVIQVSHPLVQNQLVDYIHNGFLVPVMGPALHKTSIEEMIASTAYLDLFLRSVSETALVKTFLRFVLLHRYDNSTILDTLVSRISSNSRLCMVSLSLFKTLLSLNCEDVLLQLVLRYLIPCNHVMLSQKRAVKDLDIYGKTADKFLSLIPRCCQKESFLLPEQEEEHATWSKGHGSPSIDTSSVTTVPKPSTPSRISFFLRQQSIGSESIPTPRSPGFMSPDTPTGSPRHSALRWEEVSELEYNYLEYLQEARVSIDQCVLACRIWSAPYDGDEPKPGSVRHLSPDENAITLSQDYFSADRRGHHSGPSAQNLAPAYNTENRDRQGTRFNKSTSSITPRSKKRSLQEEVVIQQKIEAGKESENIPEAAVDRKDSSTLLNGSHELETYVQQNSNRTKPCQTDGDLAVKKVKRDTSEETPFSTELENQGELPELPRRDGTCSSSVSQPVQEYNVSAKAPAVTEHASLDNELPKSVDSLIDELLEKAPAEVNGATINIERFTEELKEFEDKMNGQEDKEDASVQQDPALSREEEEAYERFVSHPDHGSPATENSHGLPKSQILTSPVRTPGQPPSQPFTGPFVAVLFAKLENMLQNSLYVNFLLTGIIAHLACYPQPLLRSFLLNTNMVFQPSVKSLVQVLGSVKNKIETFAASQEDFPALLFKAKKYLIARGKLDWNESQNMVPSLRRSETLVKSRKPSIGELILRHTNSPTRARQAAQLAFQHVRDGQVLHALSGTSLFKSSAEKQNEALRVKNAVYCAVIFSEFLKELAAITQEHAVTSPFLLESVEE